MIERFEDFLMKRKYFWYFKLNFKKGKISKSSIKPIRVKVKINSYNLKLLNYKNNKFMNNFFISGTKNDKYIKYNSNPGKRIRSILFKNKKEAQREWNLEIYNYIDYLKYVRFLYGENSFYHLNNRLEKLIEYTTSEVKDEDDNLIFPIMNTNNFFRLIKSDIFYRLDFNNSEIPLFKIKLIYVKSINKYKILSCCKHYDNYGTPLYINSSREITIEDLRNLGIDKEELFDSIADFVNKFKNNGFILGNEEIKNKYKNLKKVSINEINYINNLILKDLIKELKKNLQCF